MTLELRGKYSDIKISVNYNGELVLDFENYKEVFESILESVYSHISIEDFIKTLDYDQMAEISNYFETIKDNK